MSGNTVTNLSAVAVALTATFLSQGAHAEELIAPVRPFADMVVASLDDLPDARKELLRDAADYVVRRAEDGETVKMVFVCTHNSRRSHLSQIWFQAAAAYFDVPNVESYSGGTEATACNIRTIHALRRAGLSIVATNQGSNPLYLTQYSDSLPPIRTYSKIYSTDGNPSSGFAAMMCCSDADRKCPNVRGADARFALHYQDPKVSDNTTLESATYDERNFQIAQEMFFILSEASRQLKESRESGNSSRTGTSVESDG